MRLKDKYFNPSLTPVLLARETGLLCCYRSTKCHFINHINILLSPLWDQNFWPISQPSHKNNIHFLQCRSYLWLCIQFLQLWHKGIKLFHLFPGANLLCTECPPPSFPPQPSLTSTGVCGCSVYCSFSNEFNFHLLWGKSMHVEQLTHDEVPLHFTPW